MRRLDLAFALTILAATGLAGCATSSLDMAPDSPDRPWQPQTDAAGAIVPGPPALAASVASARRYQLPANPALAAVPPPPPLEQAHAYGLPELIDLAESENPLTRIAWNDARNVALAAGIARSAYLPQLSVAAMGWYAGDQGSNSSVLDDSSVSASSHGATPVVALQWLLFDFGGRAARVEAASQATVMANISFTAVHQQVIYDVSVAFYGYQAARSRIATTRQGVDNAEAILAAAQSRYKHGIGTVIEVAQATQNQRAGQARSGSGTGR